MKDGGDDDKKHPWESDTSTTHKPEENRDIDMGEASTPAETLITSKHAPADIKQREEAIELAVRIAEEEEGEAEEEEKEE